MHFFTYVSCSCHFSSSFPFQIMNSRVKVRRFTEVSLFLITRYFLLFFLLFKETKPFSFYYLKRLNHFQNTPYPSLTNYSYSFMSQFRYHYTKVPLWFSHPLFCYDLKVCVLSKFTCENINPQNDGFRRWGIWEVLRSSKWSPHKCS